MLCTLVIMALVAVIVIQNRAVLIGDIQEIKRIWGGKPPTPPAA